MNNNNSSSSDSVGLVTILIRLIVVVVSLVALYYLYRTLYTDKSVKATTLLQGKRQADISPDVVPAMPAPFEGGEYTFSTWVYINSFNKNMNTRKHIFEIKGDNFSTLLVALGAFKNTLVVRTHNKDIVVGENFQGMAASSKARQTTEAFQGAGGATSTQPPNAADASTAGTLSKEDVGRMFTPMAMDDSLLTTPQTCDLPEIDMQRWVLITVVLSGRTIDVYLDGKLARSCVTSSYYKVDPTGVKPVICGRGGFDGYVSNMAVANYGMSPDEIYRTYLSGPEGGFSNVLDSVTSMFTGSSV